MSPSLQTMGFFMSDINFCNTKEQLNHLGEVVTGKVDGSPTGADIDTSTLPYTGQVRKTLPALEDEYEQSITDKEAEADAAIDEYRLLNKGPYASGIALESKFEYITYNGESYFANNPPYTTTATTPDADGNLFAGGYTTIETVANKIGNPNLLSNHNFLTPSPDAITHPNATPESYVAGTQVFSGVYAGSSGVTVTLINGRVNCSSGSYEYRVANNNGLDRVPVFTSSVSDYDGNPVTTGVSHALVSDEYVVTVTPAAGDVFSVKFEQGDIATRHEVGGLSSVNLFSYTDTSFWYVSDIAGVKHPSVVNVKGFRELFVGEGRWVTTGKTGPVNYTPSLNASGQIVIVTSDGVELKYSPVGGIGNPSAVGCLPNDLTADNASVWDSLIAPNDTEVYKWDLGNDTYRMSVWRVRSQEITSGPDGKIQVFYGGVNPVMGQINTGAKIRDVNLFCEESNLDLARCGFTNAENFEWIGGSISGFRDTTNLIDAWGAYFENCSGRFIRVGLGQNSQSDIAVVGNCPDLEIEGCYEIGSGESVHINFEPLGSSDYNRNTTLSNMSIKKLSALENGSGGTANEFAVVSCDIDVFKNDGAKISFINTRFNGFERESQPYFGEYSFMNSLGLGANLLSDPNLINIGFGASGATSNNNDWFYNAGSGDIDSANVMTPINEDGFRFVRFNPNGQTGTFQIKPIEQIDLGAGGYLAVVITGRQVSGTSGAYFQFQAPSDVGCILLRQSNEGSGYWQTQMLIIPDEGPISINPSLWATANDTFDIARITAHRVFSNGSNSQKVIDTYHADLSGFRTIERASLPTMAAASLDGFLPGDRVTVGASDYVYTGSQAFELVNKS